MKVEQFLWDYLDNIKKLEMTKEQFKNYNYLDSHMDSFEIIQFIMAIEMQFSITLLPEDIESEEIRTIGGLISIIERKL